MKQAKGFWLPDDDSYFQEHLDTRGFQIEHLDKALSYVTNFDVAIDVGAHIGTWSIEMSHKFKNVYSFEAHPDTFECLEKNIADRNIKNIQCYENAVGDTINNDYCIGNDVKRLGNTGSRYLFRELAEYRVNMITLDSLNLKHVDFIKLDIEGFEYFALKGAMELIEKFRPVLIVEEKSFNYRYDLDDKKATNYLLNIGYNCVDKIGKDYIFKF